MGMHEKIQEVDRTWHVKLAIRAITAIVAIVAIGLVTKHVLDLARIRDLYQAWIDQHYGFAMDMGFYAMPQYVQFTYLAFIPFGLSVFWFVLYSMFYTLRKRPIHPGWTIAYDLVLVGGYITYTYFLFRMARYLLEADNTVCTTTMYQRLETANSTFESNDVPRNFSTDSMRFKLPSEDDYLDSCHLYTKSPMWTVGMMIALTVIHFFLAIWAMFDTSYRRHQVVGKRMADDIINEMEANRRRSGHRIEEESVI